MTDQSPRRNSFRANVLHGECEPLVVGQKQPRLGGSGDALKGAIVPRSEIRRGDHRDQNRHRLTGEGAFARFRGGRHEVELINLSSSGAMIRAGFPTRLWEIVELELGEGTSIEAAVRWVKDDCIGLEFAHETGIQCDPDDRARLLLDVIQRSFPGLPVGLEAPEQEEAGPARSSDENDDAGTRATIRHPLVWSGHILFAFNSNPVRLRNISSGGALVDVQMIYPVGSEVTLDLGEAGKLDSKVSWAHGDQAGLRFEEPFDVANLARLRPELATQQWERPDFLDRMADDGSPWDDQWGRTPLDQLRAELEGFLKH